MSILKRGEASEIYAPVDLRGNKLQVCKENHETGDDECSLEAEVLHPAAMENWILLTVILEEVTEEVMALANTLNLASGDSQQRAQQMVPRFLTPRYSETISCVILGSEFVIMYSVAMEN